MTISVASPWGTLRIKSVVSKIGSGKTPAGGAETYATEGITFLRSQNIHFDGLRLDDVAYIDEATHAEMQGTQVKTNDVLLNITGASLGRVTCAPRNLGTANVNQHVCILRPTREVNAKYLTYFLSSRLGQEQIFELQVGGNRDGLNFEQVGHLRLPAAPLNEQRRIADFLDSETGRIDTLVTAKERASSLIDERRVALIRQYCLRGMKEQTNFKDTGFGPFGLIPAHWAIKRNKTFIREINNPSQYGGEELLTVSHLTGVTPRREKTVNMFQAESTVGYKMCRPGDLVINTLWAWMGALGVSQHEGIVSPAYGVYRFTSQDTLPEYFDLLFRTPEYVTEMTRYSKGVWTSRLRLYPESFLALSTPVPPLDEQEAIVTAVQREIGPGHKLQEKLRRSNKLLAERRAALITAAVTGQFDVSTASGRNVTEGVTV
ncbi:restriction endonuclease subunit S [Streptomyces olivaceus]|uniref:restriction endonuclease subunit S n=1 Tax=Streptomyces olivaceus TaxID=47716 RepID=UPI001CCF9A32|nr:restriction endonuclease subunit S [Streptomyces olivaceus]MBZ6203875.1 restriction endonuclease subunit S [Streptomyces olivaceus]MBZ6308835.1 restriction endonuclease subunit S [Streptomyces olivaceus]MBZ6322925.1 restriction endonuclease subunit S [Streptomyces olivaceus]